MKYAQTTLFFLKTCPQGNPEPSSLGSDQGLTNGGGR